MHSGVWPLFPSASHEFPSIPPTIVQDIEPLRTLPRLKYLSLLENPITKQKGYRCEDVRVSACPSKAVWCAKVVTRKYGLCLVGLPSTPLPLDSLAFRLYVISRLPHLKVLDFRKVKQTERQEAVRQYPMGLAPAPAATFEPDEDLAEVRGLRVAGAAGWLGAAQTGYPARCPRPLTWQLNSIANPCPLLCRSRQPCPPLRPPRRRRSPARGADPHPSRPPPSGRPLPRPRP